MTAPELADEYGAAYLFISAYDEKEESWDQDFGPETNSVEAILNIVTAIDLCQDLAGVALGYYVKGFWPLLIIAIPMLIGDLYALYLVSLDRPFLFFDSPFLEKYILWQIMALDIIFDFIFFAVFLIFSDFEWFFTFMAVVSGIIFGFDLYQLYMFFYRYRVEDVGFDGRDVVDEDE